MGLFDWLRPAKSNVEVLDDVIWLTTTAKLAGIAKSIEERGAVAGRTSVTLLVAHFDDCLAELQQLVEQRRLGRFHVTPILAKSLERGRTSAQQVDDQGVIDIVVGERHPLRKHDDAVLDAARNFPYRCRIVHHMSLEDPLMKAYAGEWVQSILKRLGMAEDEAIQSQMVGRRFQQAQATIAKQAVGDSKSRSAEEWLARNCPQG